MSEAMKEVPFYLEGNFAPVLEEVSVDNLPVQGTLPADLNGLYVRNGPNPGRNHSSHWFTGDGMLHGLQLRDGNAEWYRNRYVQTRALHRDGRFIGDNGVIDRTVALANTHIYRHAGKMLALVENGFPTEVTPELETVGIFDFGGKLKSAMTAHPKTCPVTGEMFFFGYHFAEPFLMYHRVSAAGELEFSREIDVTGPTMIHDFAITRDHVIFLDLPVAFDLEMAIQGQGLPYKWSDTYPARIGVLPRANETAPVQWFEIEPCYVFHVMNAFDRGDCVVLDAARYPNMWKSHNLNFTSAVMTRWELNLKTGDVKESQLDDHSVEFPVTHPDKTGLEYRFGYAPNFDNNVAVMPRGLLKYDMADNLCTAFDFEEEVQPGEFSFAPSATSASEDDGYLVGLAYRPTLNVSSLYVFSAADAGSKPVARVDLPVRVPFGFHGSWMPA